MPFRGENLISRSRHTHTHTHTRVINVIGFVGSIKNQFRRVHLIGSFRTATLDITLPTYIPFCLVASSYRARAGLIAYQAQGSRAGGDLIEAGILIKLCSLWSHISPAIETHRVDWTF